MSNFTVFKITILLFSFIFTSNTAFGQEIIPISIEEYQQSLVVNASLKEVPVLQTKFISMQNEVEMEQTKKAYEAAGVLAGSQSAPMAFDPLPIVEVSKPALLQADDQVSMKWQYRPKRSVIWVDIADSNTVDYDPGRIYETTYFRRLITTDGVNWLESETVKISIEDTGYKYVSNEK